MTYIETQNEHFVSIEGIEESVITNYFITINREEFEETVALFAEDGELLAPFEKPIVGKKEIALYLSKEAQGMQLLPRQGVYEATEDNYQRVKILGKVQTSLFSVNVAWYFNLNSQGQITTAQIKLLASPQELLGLQQKRERTV